MAAALLALAGFGLALAVVQAIALRLHLRRLSPEPRSLPFMSILKPLCGVDDDLERNLRSFARLRYPAYEVLLGVKDAHDAALEVALEAARRWPRVFRVVLQKGAPGLNRKVNQLITLSAAARGEILVVSDSNVRVRRDYLRGIAAAFDDPGVGLVTHPVAGVGERSVGALLDNLTLCGSIAPGVVSAKRIAHKDVVVGKSMALRRADLRAMGGFERLKDVLAEDFLSGRIVVNELGKRVALVPEPVLNVSRSQSVAAFFSRYLRWSVMQRKAVGNVAYAAQILLNPVALAAAALLVSPGRSTVFALLAVAVARASLHGACVRAIRGRGSTAMAILAPMGDLLLAAAWALGLLRSEIDWRGKRLIVRDGTRLEPAAAPEFPAAEAQPGLG